MPETTEEKLARLGQVDTDKIQLALDAKENEAARVRKECDDKLVQLHAEDPNLSDYEWDFLNDMSDRVVKKNFSPSGAQIAFLDKLFEKYCE